MTRKLLGCLLIGLGVSVLLMPVLQALVFFSVGTFVLRDQFGWAQAAVERVRRRVPFVIRGAEAAERRVIAFSRRQVAKVPPALARIAGGRNRPEA